MTAYSLKMDDLRPSFISIPKNQKIEEYRQKSLTLSQKDYLIRI
jgi:hypothetical protein